MSKACLLLCGIFAVDALAQDNAVLQDGTELYPYGMGVYENLGENIYVGAIYVPLLDTGIEPGSSKRLEMRISAASLSARRFTRLWMDAITLNSSRDERSALAEEIQAFAELFQLGLERGDSVRFDYLKGSGETLFLFNGVTIGKMPGREFHDILLKSWIGKTPSSLQLKAGLLNEADAEVRRKNRELFAGLQFPSERHALVAERHAAADDAEAAPAAAEEESAAPEPLRLAEAQRREAEQRAEQERLARLEQERLEREREAQRLAEARAAEEAKRAAEEQTRLADEYRVRLSQWLASRVEYPQRALQRGNEGRVEMSISVGRGGEVLQHEITASSGNGMLDQATLDMLQRALPLPAMPAELAGDSFEFVMPVTFSLED